jgi:Asp-tRNA(Asn)/Glu-tRNA(Gln) amidotransferase A subunit family amidase
VLTELSLRDAATLIEQGAIDPVRYVDALWNQFEQTRSLGGVITPLPDELRRAVPGNAVRGPLGGVPLVIKDNIDVAGTATTAGSLALAGAVASRSAPLVERLLAAGALILGKANMHEFAVGITNNNAAFGPARNPADPARIPGGSSGGTATVVASFAAPAGIGTDTGGSIRIPAALCGIVGFRPSVGRWPTQGSVPISPTMDTAGPMARTVVDCALLDSVVTGGTADLEDVALSGLRIGVPRPYFWDDLEPEMRAAGEDVLALLCRHGVTLVECEVPEVADISTASTHVALFELVPSVRGYFHDHALEFERAEFLRLVRSPDVRAIFELLLTDAPVSPGVYDHAVGVLRPGLRRAYSSCLSVNRLDAIIFPTTPLAAVPIGQDESVVLNGRAVPTFATFIRNTSPSAFAGLPGISLPMGRTATGLPQGIELDGELDSDRRLLAIANSVEAVLNEL